jgi:hypothetical protein
MKADKSAAQAAEDHAKAVQELVDIVRKLNDVEFDYEEASMAAAEAVLELADQELATKMIMDDSSKTKAEQAQALYDLRGAQIDSAQAAFAQAEAWATENGAALDSAEGQALVRDELYRLRETFPTLKSEIDRYIENLLRIPREINTTIKLSNGRRLITGGAGQTVGVIEASGITRSANGGSMRRGDVHLVGERGPELFQASSSGRIIPNDRTTNSIGGGSGINVVVNAGIGTDGSQVGRLVVDELKKYERRNGPGWRAA